MQPYITIGGSGTRLKDISPVDKHLLFFKDKRIIEWILDLIPNASIVGQTKTVNRLETLKQITENNDILVIDCDIIPIGIDISKIPKDNDCVFVFKSDKAKWGSVQLDENNKVANSSESTSISNIKCSGIYFIKNLNKTMLSMTNPNSIISGMVGASIIYEDTFLRLGDIEDYTFAIKSLC